MLTVYTSIYGGYDQLRPHPAHPAVTDWVCFTDEPLECDGWTVVVEPRRHPHPRMAAKWRKCHPPDSDLSIWIDGSIDVTPEWIDAAIAGLDHADLVLHQHPNRSSIVAEAEASLTLEKYRGLPVHQQAAYYINEWGWPDTVLYAAGAFARRHTPQVLQLGAAWYAECEHWTYQDQISLPPLVGRYGIQPALFEHTITHASWLRIRSHRSNQ